MARSGRGAAVIAGIAAGTTLFLAVLWAVAVPALLELPTAWRSAQVAVAGGMAGVVLLVNGLVKVLFRWRWRRRRPAELPLRQLLALLLGCVVAVGMAWWVALRRVPPPYGAALAGAHLGVGVLGALLGLCLTRLLLRSETVRQVSGGGGADPPLRPSWSRVGLRGYLLFGVVLLGLGVTCLVVSFAHVQTHRETLAQRARSAIPLLDLVARRVESVPQSRILSTVERARVPAGYVLRVVSRDGRPFGRDARRRAANGQSRASSAPLQLVAKGRCRSAGTGVAACRWTPLRSPHEELAVVALVLPSRRVHAGRTLLALLLFCLVLTAFAAVAAYLMARDVSLELSEVAARIHAMAERPEHGLGTPVPPSTSDEMGELLHRFGELQQTLAGQVARAEADVHRSVAVDRAKTAFIEEVDYALRTPLTAVIGYAELLREGAYGAISAEQAQDVQITLESSQQLLDLVQDIVDVSFAEAGGIQLRPEAVDLGELVRGALSSARAGSTHKAVSLRHWLPPELPPVRLDPARIRRVLDNLLSNALKFTTAGEIVVTVEAPVEGRIRIGVRDTGMGIALEHQSLIFEQYRQAPQARPKQLRGSGLGLAIVQQLVRLHGGQVWLESTPGQGSEFFFSLPVEGPPADPAAGAVGASP